MKTVHNPLHRLIAVASMIALFAAVILAVVFLGPAPARANTSGPVSQLITPPAPPPLHPPIQTPEPGGAVTIQAGGGSSSAEAIPFRPKEYITRGQPLVLPQSAEKLPVSASKTGDTVVPQAAYTPPDLSAQGWIPQLQETFDSFNPPALYTPFSPTVGTSNWTVYDFGPDPNTYRGWGAVDYTDGGLYWAAWPAAFGPDAVDWHGGYPNDMVTWLDYGPLDLSTMTDFYVGFQLWFHTEPQYDWVKFCVSTDGSNYGCDYWSGYSEGWLDQSYWLTSYAGYQTVYVAWLFVSDSSIGGPDYLGPFVDNIYVWADNTPPATPPPPSPLGQLIRNGSFEDNGGSLQFWTAPSAVLTDSTYVEGVHSVYLWNPGSGSDFLSQALSATIASGVDSVVVDYWFALPTYETTRGRDYFCASLRDASVNPIYSDASMLVDLGCLDALDTTGNWQESIFALTASEIAQIANKNVALLFEMYNDYNNVPGTGSTALYVDYVRVYAAGGSAASIDSHEPNNDKDSATTGLTCGVTMTGTVGDALGGYDIDWFRLNITQTVSLQLDVDAQTKVQDPRSTLDSFLRLYNASGTEIAVNDDDGVTFDSFISTTVTAGTYYASVESYTGAGGPLAYYDLAARCNSAEAAPVGGNVQEPPADTWTVMLYLNGEDPNFTDILTQYRTGIESFIGSKQPWLRVVILYDGPNNGDTVRYLVGTTQWSQGELNMGDPGTLANFVAWAMDNYPAENYYLAIDDHGDGAYGTSWDTQPAPGNLPQLTPPEIYSALKEATNNGARKIDIVDFESCLMGLTENAYDLRQWADYVVFSQQISWGINTYPVYFSDLAATDTPVVVGQRIVERYSAGSLALRRPHTISFVDTSKFAALQTAVSNFGDALSLNGAGDQSRKDLTFAARNASQGFAASNDATNPAFAEYIDLWDLAAQASARGLAAAQAAAVQNAVDDAVVAERHYSGGLQIGSTTYNWNHSRAHGLSIYYPVDRGSSAFGNPGGDPNYTSYTAAPYLYQMSQDGKWDEFLIWALPNSGARGGGGRPMNAGRAALKDFNLSIGTTFVSVPIYLPLIRK